MQLDFIGFIEQQIQQHIQTHSASSAPRYPKEQTLLNIQNGILQYQLEEPIKLFLHGLKENIGYFLGTGYVSYETNPQPFSSYFFERSQMPETSVIHRHDFYECTYILEGEYCYGIGDQIVELKQGDCILMDTNCIHWDRYPQADTKVIFVAFQKELLQHITSLAKSPLLASHLLSKRSEKEQHFLIYQTNFRKEQLQQTSLLFQMFAEYEEWERNYQQILSCLLERFFYRLEENGREYILKKSTHDDQIMLQIDQLIGEKLSVASPSYLQEQLHFNTAYYNRLVKKRFGITLVQYIQKKRLNKARQLLSETELPIGKIIEEIGYQNRYYFYTLFEKETGMTPQQYREQGRYTIWKSNTP